MAWRDDDELNRLKDERNKLNYPTDKMHYRQLSKLIKNKANQLKKDFYQAKASNINEAATSRDLEKLFRSVKHHGVFNNKAPLPSVCNTLKEHFKQHFNKAIPSEIPHELVNTPDYVSTLLLHIPTDFINGDPPDETEVISAIKQLKLRKSTTDTPAEPLQALISDTDSIHVYYYYSLCRYLAAKRDTI